MKVSFEYGMKTPLLTVYLYLLFLQVAGSNKWHSLSPAQFLLLWESVLQWLTQCSSSLMHETGEKKTKEPTDAVTREDELLGEDFKAQICVENNRKLREKESTKQVIS